MEFKSSFPWQFYLLTAIAQAAGVMFYVHHLTWLIIIFALADLYVLMKIIFKTQYVLDERGLTAKRFMLPDVKIAYSAVVEVKPTDVFTPYTMGNAFVNKRKIEHYSFNFITIVYTVKWVSSLSGRKRKTFIVHPKDKKGFYDKLESHCKNADFIFEYKIKATEKEEKKSKKK